MEFVCSSCVCRSDLVPRVSSHSLSSFSLGDYVDWILKIDRRYDCECEWLLLLSLYVACDGLVNCVASINICIQDLSSEWFISPSYYFIFLPPEQRLGRIVCFMTPASVPAFLESWIYPSTTPSDCGTLLPVGKLQVTISVLSMPPAPHPSSECTVMEVLAVLVTGSVPVSQTCSETKSSVSFVPPLNLPTLLQLHGGQTASLCQTRHPPPLLATSLHPLHPHHHYCPVTPSPNTYSPCGSSY